jgi:hypothetical protein
LARRKPLLEAILQRHSEALAEESQNVSVLGSKRFFASLRMTYRAFGGGGDYKAVGQPIGGILKGS